jgi:hypothetical protein
MSLTFNAEINTTKFYSTPIEELSNPSCGEKLTNSLILFVNWNYGKKLRHCNLIIRQCVVVDCLALTSVKSASVSDLYMAFASMSFVASGGTTDVYRAIRNLLLDMTEELPLLYEAPSGTAEYLNELIADQLKSVKNECEPSDSGSSGVS